MCSEHQASPIILPILYKERYNPGNILRQRQYDVIYATLIDEGKLGVEFGVVCVAVQNRW